MQYIYAYETTASAPASQFQNFLEKSILSVKDQYLYLLLCIREIANFVETDAKIKAGKHLKNDNDKKLTESEAYVDYLTNGTEFNVEADKSIITFLLNNLILEDGNFTTNMEELFTNWMDDAEFVVEAVHEVIQKSKNELKLHLEKGNLKEKAHYKLIEPKLKNWETDRLAIIDVILIRMAVSEFLYFPSIPVKVTINEYLDIAKEYSTPKSKDFINGVLDSLMRDMKTNDQLNKTGRGLL